MSDVIKSTTKGAVTLLTIDHPKANAINREVISGLIEGVNDAVEGGAHCILITGAGEKFFAAGADISEFGGAGAEMLSGGQKLTSLCESVACPVVALVNGIAYGGGCELTLACDVRIASTTARFGQPEIKLGIIPGWGGTQRLPRLIGRSRAMTMLLTGDPIDAKTALDWGLVTELVEPDALLERGWALGEQLASMAPRAVDATKKAVHVGLGSGLSEGLASEATQFQDILVSDDAREGIMAFFEKRQPVWSGR